MFVRPPATDEDDEVWSASVEQWRSAIHRMSGNRVEVLEIGSDEIRRRLHSRQPVWRDIRREGIIAYGAGLDEMVERRSA